MKKIMASILCLMLFAAPIASANPFITAPEKTIDSWDLSDGMALVGEDVFDAMLTEVKLNIIVNAGQEAGIGFTYSPCLYATIDSLIAEDVNPHEAVYRIGDDSPELNAYFIALKAKGYIDELPSDYTEGIANEIRKIQYAAGLPATGEITNAIARGLLTDSAVPTNEETLKLLENVSGEIRDRCTQEMDAARYTYNLISEASQKDADADIAAAALRSYAQAREYIPSFVVRYQLYLPVAESLTSTTDSEEILNTMSNSSALLHTLFYCAEYNLRHDFAGYAAEYYDLLKE